MTRTIPRLLGCVPVNDASHVWAHGRSERELTVFVAITGDSLPFEIDDLSLFAADRPGASARRRSQPILDVVIRKVQFLDEVPPCAGADFHATHRKDVAPRVLATKGGVAGHHAGERAERHPVAAKPGGHELPFGCLAD